MAQTLGQKLAAAVEQMLLHAKAYDDATKILTDKTLAPSIVATVEYSQRNALENFNSVSGSVFRRAQEQFDDADKTPSERAVLVRGFVNKLFATSK